MLEEGRSNTAITTTEIRPQEGKASGKRRVKSLKSCDVCGRGFIKLAHLIRHARTHGNERPFSCKKCEKAFARTDALQRHERAVHSINASREDMAAAAAGSPVSSSSSDTGDGGSTSAAVAQGSSHKRKRAAEADSALTAAAGSSFDSTRQVEDANTYHADFRVLLGLDNSTNVNQHHQGNTISAESQPVREQSSSTQDNASLHYGPSASFGVPDFVMPSATTFNSSLNIGSSMPITSFMASFAPSHPNISSSLDATIDSWLTQEGGSHAAESALEMVFSHDLLGNNYNSAPSASTRWDAPVNSFGAAQQSGTTHATNNGTGGFSNSHHPLGYNTPSANNGSSDSAMSKLYPFGLQFEDIWKTSPPTHQFNFQNTPLANASNSVSEPPQPAHSNFNTSNTSVPSLAGASATDSTQRRVSPHSSSITASSSSYTLPSISTTHSVDASKSTMSPRRRVMHRVLTTDTWLNSMKMPEDGYVDLPQPDITSPEQVMGELSVETPIDQFSRRQALKDDQAAIPSMKFLDSCLHLYFRDFHPTFPILHKPTFCRHQCPPLLLLSMCSIGCIFMGTQSAREKGLWIYERLHHVIVFSRDSRMATEHARVAMTLSGLLGQCFSFLYGEPKHMFTAESFHGCLCTFARRAGLFKLIDKNAISYENVADLDEDALEARWQEWSRREMLRRVALGLTLHAADATTYSLLPRLVPVQLSLQDQSSDALFEAEDASSWKWLLLCLSGGSPGSNSRTPPSSGFQVVPTADTLFPMSILAQKIVNTLQLKEMCRSEVSLVSNYTDIVLFYKDMLDLAGRLGIQEHRDQHVRQSHGATKSSSSQTQILKVMWHYCCLARLARLDQIEEVAGREGVPQQDTTDAVKQWVKTPEARLATLHCAHVLYQAADLKDLAFIVPRAIFQSTLLLLCFIAFNEPVLGPVEVFNATEVTDWEYFAKVLASCAMETSSGATASQSLDQHSAFDFVTNGRPLLAEKWIRQNACRWRLDKFLDGREKQMDYVSLLSTTTRLLRRCTPWGIGDAMGDILATINIGN